MKKRILQLSMILALIVGCASPREGFAQCTVTLTSGAGSNIQTKCINTPISNITYSFGFWVTSSSATGLPSGVSFTAGTISGSPTVAGTFNYVVTASCGAAGTATAIGTITVNPNTSISLTSGAGSNIQTKCINTAINNITYAVGGTATNASVIGLPAGVSGSFSAGIFTISGTPSVAGTFLFTVTATGSCGSNQTATGTITVIAKPTVNAVTAKTFCPSTANNIPLAGTPAGVILDWTNSNTAIGLGASGSGNISFTSANTGTSPITGNINVTPKITQNAVTCFGTPVGFTITVNPTPVVNTVSNQVVCNGNQTNAINFNSSATGGTVEFTWTNNTPSIGLAASGSGNIAAFTATNVGNAPVVATITVTPKFTNGSITCNGTSKTFTITVNPTPKVNTVSDQFVCNGNQLNIMFVSPTTGGILTMNWTNNNPAIGLGASGSGNILFTGTNTTDTPISGTVTVTPSFANGLTCVGQPVVFTITINPTPKVDNITNKAHCNGSPTGIVDFTSPTNGVNMEFAWTNSNTAIGLGASGTGDLPSFTATNSSNAPIVATITVTPKFTNGGVTCTGTAKTFTITVNPTPKVNTVNNLTVCHGNNATVTFTSPTTGGTLAFAWTNDNPAIGLSTGGTGNFSFTAINFSNTPISAVITVTPTFTNGSVSCPGNPVSFTITVNPTPIVNPVPSFVGCNGVVTKLDFSSPTSGGTMSFAWTNNNIGIGLGSSGTGNIVFLSVNGGNGPVIGAINVTPKITTNAVTCNGTPVNFTITINPTPKVNAVANQPICNGASSNAINFTSPNTGGTVAFSWTNNNPSIGLGGSGTGNIPAFTATNIIDAPSNGKIDVVPSYVNSSGGPTCDGLSTNLFSFIVNPTPKVNNVLNQIVCVSTPTNLPFSSPTTGGTMEYAWTNSNAAIGLGTSGNGNLSFTSVNGANGTIVGNLVVTPKFTNIITCTGSTKAFSITVNPLPKVNAIASQEKCKGASSDTINFSSPNTGGTLEYSWTNSNTAIGLGASGTGDIGTFVTANSTFSTISGTVSVIPKFTNTNGLPTCSGTASTFTMTVNPSPVVADIALSPFCASDSVKLHFSSNPTGSTFAWTNTNTAIGLSNGGNGPISFKAASNLTSGTIEGIVSATPTSDKGCKGLAKTFSLTLKPTPQLDTIPPFSQCSALPFDLVDFSISPIISGAQNYSWSNTGVPGLAASGTGQIPIFTPTYNSTGSDIVGNISYTVTVAGCVSTSKIFPVKVFTHPNLGMTITENSGALPNDYVICQSDSVTVSTTVTKSLPPYTYLWSTNQTSDKFTEAVSATGDKYYSVTVTDKNGCKNYTFKLLTINKYPAVSLSFIENSGINGSDAKICKQDSIAFTAAETNGSSPVYAFAWNVNNLTTKSIKIAPDSTRTYVVSVTNSGCRTTASKVVEVFVLPVAKISPPLTTICSGTSELLKASGGSAYKWSPGNQTKDTLTISPSAQTTYAVTVTDANRCLATTSMTVSVLNSPRIDSISGKKEITCGEKIDLVCVNNCSTCTYGWSNQSTTKSIQVSSAGKYSVVLTDTLTKCAVTKSIDITGGGDIPKIDSIKRSTEAPICGSGMLELSVKDSSAVYDYLWNTQSNKTSKIQVSSNGTYIVTVTNKLNTACKKELSWTVNNFKPAVSSAWKVVKTTCQASNGSILLDSIKGTAGFNFKWNDSTIDTNYRKNLTEGNYQLTITDKNDCKEALNFKVDNVGLVPSFTITPDKTSNICDTTTKVVLSTASCLNCEKYNWNTTSTSSVAEISKNGNYVVTVSDIAGCTTVKSIDINNFKTPVTSRVTVQNSTCGDANGTITITVESGTGGFSYKWENGNSANFLNNLVADNYALTITDANNCTDKKSISLKNNGIKPVFTIQSSNTKPICDSTGIVELTIDGCSQCKTYQWSNSSNNAKNAVSGNGVYMVTVTNDSNCVASREYTVDNFKTPVSSIATVKGSTCQDANGEVQLTVKTGTPPYTYKWNDNANLNSATRSNLGAATYSVTITDNNTCTKINTANVTNQGEKPNFTITPDITAKICDNVGQLTLMIDSCAGCTYKWSNGSTLSQIVVDSNQTIEVTAIRGSCKLTKLVKVDNFAPPVMLNVAIEAATCKRNDGSIAIDVTSGLAPFKYKWSASESNTNVLKNIAAGSYSVTVKDARDCSSTINAIVDSVNTLVADSIYLFKSSNSALYVYPKESLCYEWRIETSPGNYKAADCLNGKDTLHYCELAKVEKVNLKLTDCTPLGCVRLITQVRVGAASALPSSISVYPNPSDRLLHIQISSASPNTYQCSIYDLLGRPLRSNTFRKNATEATFDWDLQDLDAGAYLLLLTDEQGEQSQYKIIVQR